MKNENEPRSAPFSPRQNLTATEKEILELLAQGWTARETAGRMGLAYSASSLTDPSYNVQLGVNYFQRLFSSYGSYPLAIAAYNAGPGNVNKWIRDYGDPRMPGGDIVRWVEQIPIFETKNYVQRVLENAVVYDLMNPEHARSRGPANLSWYLGKNRPG